MNDPIAQSTSNDDRNLAMLAHLLGIVSGFVGALIIWLLKKDQSAFIDEQGVSEAEDLDGRDGEALHLIAVERGDTVVATCRLLAAGAKIKLGRVAVLQRARRRGLALELLLAADEHAVGLGGERIVLAAQTYAMGLYEQAGYRVTSDVFLDAGIEHVWMEKRL